MSTKGENRTKRRKKWLYLGFFCLQIEHMLLSMDDTLRRFSPKVARGKVMLRFVPVCVSVSR